VNFSNSFAPPALLLSVLCMACASDDAAEGDGSRAETRDGGVNGVSVLVGELSDSDVKLGVIATPQRARLFFCGGPDSYEDMTRWVVAELDTQAAFELEADGGWRLSGQLDDGTLSGRLERDGQKSVDFIARRVEPDTLAGVYEGMDECGRVGLIVTQPSQDEPASAQGACVGPGHLPKQVNPILPIARSDDGAIGVELAGDDGPRAASVTAAAAPE
jgi:hypothetical protein